MALQVGYAAIFMSTLTFLILIVAFSIEHFAVDDEEYEDSVWTEYLEVARFRHIFGHTGSFLLWVSPCLSWLSPKACLWLLPSR